MGKFRDAVNDAKKEYAANERARFAEQYQTFWPQYEGRVENGAYEGEADVATVIDMLGLLLEQGDETNRLLAVQIAETRNMAAMLVYKR